MTNTEKYVLKMCTEAEWWRNCVAAELEKLPTLCVGQDADLKVDTGVHRVWLSRCDETIDVEALCKGKWRVIYSRRKDVEDDRE